MSDWRHDRRHVLYHLHHEFRFDKRRAIHGRKMAIKIPNHSNQEPLLGRVDLSVDLLASRNAGVPDTNW